MDKSQNGDPDYSAVDIGLGASIGAVIGTLFGSLLSFLPLLSGAALLIPPLGLSIGTLLGSVFALSNRKFSDTSLARAILEQGPTEGCDRRLTQLILVPNEQLFFGSLLLSAYSFFLLSLVNNYEWLSKIYEHIQIHLKYVNISTNIVSGIFTIYVSKHYISAKKFIFIFRLSVVVLFLASYVTALEHLVLIPCFVLNDIPLGGIAQQTFLSLCLLLLSLQGDWRERRNIFLSRLFIRSMSIGGIVIVIVSNILQGDFYAFDVIYRVVFGVFLFWWIDIWAGLRFRTGEEEHFGMFCQRFIVFSSFIFLLGLLFTVDPQLWASFVGIAFMALILTRDYSQGNRLKFQNFNKIK